MPGDPPHITILAHDENNTQYKVEIPGFWCEDVYEGGQTFQKIWVPVYGTTMENGKPELPVVRGLMGYPEGKDTSNITVVSTIPVDFYNYLIYPHQPDYRIGSQPPPFQWDQDFYNKDILYPGDNANLSNEGVLRDIMVVNNNVQSFQYDPYYRHLKVAKEMVINIEYGFAGKESKKGVSPKGGPSGGVAEEFVPLYRACIWNYENLDAYPLPLPIDYLIITGDSYRLAINPLIDVLRDRGFTVCVTNMSEISSLGNPISVYQYIKDMYNNYDIAYVLLIGDAQDLCGREMFNYNTMVPFPYWLYEDPYQEQDPLYSRPSDICYSCYRTNPPGIKPESGNDPAWNDWWENTDVNGDWYPDLFIGRITADNIQEVDVVVNKLKTYELKLDPPDPNSPPWYDKMLFVAHHEKWAGDTKTEIRGNQYDIPLPQVELLIGSTDPNTGPTNDDVINSINNGCSLVNYLGHGGIDKWISWTLHPDHWGDIHFRSNPHVVSLNNQHYVVAINMGCYMGGLDNAEQWANYECLCDYWIRVPGLLDPYHGAVASIGCTRYGWTHMDPYLDENIFYTMYGVPYDGYQYTEPLNTIGAVNSGAIIMTMINDGNSKDKVSIYASHILFGEPSMRIRNKWTENQGNSIVKHDNLLKEKPLEIAFYPNPSSGIFTIEYKGNMKDIREISIYDISGRLIKSIDVPVSDTLNTNINDNASTGKIDINISDIKDGLYLVNVGDKVYKKILIIK